MYEVEIQSLKNRIIQIDQEISANKKSFGDEDLYLSELEKCSDRLYDVRNNLLGIYNTAFNRISFLRSAEVLKNRAVSSVSGQDFEHAVENISMNKSYLNGEIETQHDCIKKLMAEKQEAENQLREYRLLASEEEQN